MAKSKLMLVTRDSGYYLRGQHIPKGQVAEVTAAQLKAAAAANPPFGKEISEAEYEKLTRPEKRAEAPGAPTTSATLQPAGAKAEK